MKKNNSIKNLLKSPPISVKAFKSNQKYYFTSNDVNETQTSQEVLKSKIENISKNLNEQTKQRQFEFKQLYRMIIQLQKSRKSKCKHSILLNQRKNLNTQISHMPITVLPNQQKIKKNEEIIELNLSQKNIFSINDFGDIHLMRKQKRKSKCGTIQSHKHLPGANSSLNSEIQLGVLNEEENQKYTQKSNLETTTSQFFSTSSCSFNFRPDSRDFVSPNKSIVSNFQTNNHLQDIQLKLSYCQNKLKSFEAESSFLKEKVESYFIKQAEVGQNTRGISARVQQQSVQLAQNSKMMKQISNKISACEENQKAWDGKLHQFLIENEQKMMVFESKILDKTLNLIQSSELMQKITEIQTSNSQEFKLLKHQTSIIIQNLQNKLNQNLVQPQSQIQKIQQKINQLTVTLNKILSEKAQIKQNIEISSSFSQLNDIKTQEINEDKVAQIEAKLENFEQVVSELMKVSFALTEKINSFAKRNSSSENASLKKKQRQQNLSDDYWSLKEQLSKIDEESVQSSRQIIDESLLDLKDEVSNYQAIKSQQFL